VTMILFTCGAKKRAGGLGHPCGRAAKALDDAGHTYELRTVRGYRMAPWTWPARARDRAEIERLSGQRKVPILVLDSGEVVAGSGNIVRWVRESSRDA
jgi:glutathione S-transferase